MYYQIANLNHRVFEEMFCFSSPDVCCNFVTRSLHSEFGTVLQHYYQFVSFTFHLIQIDNPWLVSVGSNHSTKKGRRFLVDFERGMKMVTIVPSAVSPATLVHMNTMKDAGQISRKHPYLASTLLGGVHTSRHCFVCTSHPHHPPHPPLPPFSSVVQFQLSVHFLSPASPKRTVH